MKLKNFLLVSFFASATTPVFCQVANCEKLLETISKKIIANGVPEDAFYIGIHDVEELKTMDVQSATIVGSCESGTKKILYNKYRAGVIAAQSKVDSIDSSSAPFEVLKEEKSVGYLSAQAFSQQECHALFPNGWKVERAVDGKTVAFPPVGSLYSKHILSFSFDAVPENPKKYTELRVKELVAKQHNFHEFNVRFRRQLAEGASEIHTQKMSIGVKPSPRESLYVDLAHTTGTPSAVTEIADPTQTYVFGCNASTSYPMSDFTRMCKTFIEKATLSAAYGKRMCEVGSNGRLKFK